MQHLQPNTTLQGGKYRIERVLGQGGFGITYLAKRKSNGSKVAIKELFVAPAGQAINSRKGNEVVVTNASNQEEFEKHKSKFKKEAERLSKFKHRNLVKVSDYFEENGTAYYVMQYIEGESLRSKLNREGALSESLVLDYLKQLLSALEVIHREKIWHLDIKPDNIMVDGNDNIFLIDFGASKHIVQSGTLTTSSMMLLTRGYYPPEQISSNMRNIGAWTDIYALGATIYNLLTKKAPPFFDSIFSEGRNAFSFTSKVSPETRDLIIKMMNPNRKERLQNVFDVREFLNGESVNNTIHREPPKPIYDNSDKTIIERKEVKREQKSPTPTPNYNQSSTYSHSDSNNNDNSSGIIIAIVVIIVFLIIGWIYYSNNKDVSEKEISTEVVSQSDTDGNKEVEPQKDIYKERVEQFAKKQSGVIVSYPNDKRYCVYFSKSITYGHKEMYRYDAVSDKTEKLNLPIEATNGYTDLWLTKNKRYIFIAAEERYIDFIKIDTEIGQIRYIADCQKVKRTSKGFTLTQISRCLNEDTAQYSYEYEYAYIDYYYNEEGEFVGCSEEYKM